MNNLFGNSNYNSPAPTGGQNSIFGSPNNFNRPNQGTPSFQQPNQSTNSPFNNTSTNTNQTTLFGNSSANSSPFGQTQPSSNNIFGQSTSPNNQLFQNTNNTNNINNNTNSNSNQNFSFGQGFGQSNTQSFQPQTQNSTFGNSQSIFGSSNVNQQTTNFNSNSYNNNNTGMLWGDNKTSLNNSQNLQTSILSNSQSNFMNNTTPSSTTKGTSSIEYQDTQNPAKKTIKNIANMPQYSSKSLLQLRLEDYQQYKQNPNSINNQIAKVNLDSYFARVNNKGTISSNNQSTFNTNSFNNTNNTWNTSSQNNLQGNSLTQGAIWGQSTQQAQTQGGSLFGNNSSTPNNTTQPSQSMTGGSLFSNLTSNPPPSQTPSPLFGNTQTSNNLLSTTNNQLQTQSQPLTQNTPSIFGNNSSGTSGLFAGLSNNQNSQTNTSLLQGNSSLLGSKPAQTSLFNFNNSSNSNQPLSFNKTDQNISNTSTPSLFGALSNNQPPSTSSPSNPPPTPSFQSQLNPQSTFNPFPNKDNAPYALFYFPISESGYQHNQQFKLIKDLTESLKIKTEPMANDSLIKLPSYNPREQEQWSCPLLEFDQEDQEQLRHSYLHLKLPKKLMLNKENTKLTSLVKKSNSNRLKSKHNNKDPYPVQEHKFPSNTLNITVEVSFNEEHHVYNFSCFSVNSLFAELIRLLIDEKRLLKESDLNKVEININGKMANLVQSFGQFGVKEHDIISIRMINSELEEVVENPNAPRLEQSNYRTEPAIEILKAMNDDQLSKVENFSVLNEWGRVHFLEPVDLRGVNICKVIVLKQKSVELYPNLSPKEKVPAQGQGLNQPFEVTFDYLANGKSKERTRFEKKLNKMVSQMNAEIKKINYESGSVTIAVPWIF